VRTRRAVRRLAPRLKRDRLRIRALTLNTAAAQDSEDYGDADPDQQIHQGMAEVAGQIRKKEHTNSRVQQDSEDVPKCAT
jgi:hypothetical protein